MCGFALVPFRPSSASLLIYAVIGAVALAVAGLTLFSGFGLGTLLMPAFALFLSFVGLPLSVHAADMERGQLLYENHCTSCHDSRAHVRDNRRAKSLTDVRQWVVRWSDHLALNWGSDERNDVADYVFGRYYGKTE